ncbi:MAG: hypothetical protein WEA56_00290 [Balneolaceae bacterium]
MLKKSDYFILSAALIAMFLSIWLWFGVDQDAGLYVGLWVPAILGFGIYIKILRRR